MSSISPTSRPGYVYDSATDTWIPIGIGPHTHAATDISGVVDDSLIDARGDLIVGTAADTPGRLAVGANGTVLTADSTQATGLRWTTATDQFPWTAYSSTPGNLTVGNGTLVARYQQIGKTVNFEISFTFGSTSAITGSPTFALPVNARIGGYSMMGTVTLGDFGAANYPGLAVTPFGTYIYLSAINTSGANAVENAAVGATVPFTWTTNDYIMIRATYEAA